MSVRTRVSPGAAPAFSGPASLGPSVAAPEPPPPERARGGVVGWFQRAGDWVADRYDATTDAVGGFLYETGRVAGDAWDVARATDLSWRDGRLGVETDLGQVMDLLPQSARDRLRLDEHAQNRVTVAFDTRSRELSVRSDALEIEGLDLAGLRSGPARLQGVDVRIKNPSDALAWLDGSLGRLGKQDDGVSIEVGVAHAQASRVSVPGPDGAVAMDTLAVSGFRGRASNGDGLPFGARGRDTRAAFTVDAAHLAGVRHAAGTAEEIRAGAVSGGLDERAESAFLEAGHLAATGLSTADGTSVGGSAASDVRLDVRNTGGGMPVFDARPDRMAAHVGAGSASVDGLSAGGVGVEHARGDGLAVDLAQGAPTLAVAAAALEGRGVRGGGAVLGTLTAAGLAGQRTEDGFAGAADRLSAADAGYGDWHLDEAVGRDVSLASEGGGLTAAVAALDARSLDGAARVGHLEATGATGRFAGGVTTVSAPTVGVADLEAGSVRARAVTATNARASVGPDGVSGAVDRADVGDASVPGVGSLRQARVEGARGSASGTRRRTEVEQVDLRGLALPGVGAIGAGTVGDLRVDSDGDRFSAHLGLATADRISAGSLTAASGSLLGLDYAQDGARSQLALQDAGLERVAYGDAAAAERITASGVRGQLDAGGPSGTIAQLWGEGVDFHRAPDGAPSASTSPFDPLRLASTLAHRVDHADARLQVPLVPGEYHSGVDLGVHRPTVLDAGLKIREHRITELGAAFDHAVDGPLWTDLRGIYTEKDGLKANVGGWFDQDIGDDVNGALGLPGSKLLPLGAYADAAVGKLPTAGTRPPGSEVPGLDRAFDTARLSGSAAVHLSGGRVDAGVGAVTLADGDRTTNRLEATAFRGEDLTVDGPRLRADAVSARLGGAAVSAGATAIDGAHVVVDLAGADRGAVRGSVDEARVSGVRIGK